MQPDGQHSDNWQQPTAQPAQSPYAAPNDAADEAPQPVVTMQPDQTSPQEPVTEAADSEVIDEPVRWQATEYIHREKNASWFVGFAVVVILMMAAAIFLMKSITFAILIPVMALALMVYAQRPPRTINYTLGRQGLHVNDHLYSFADFKAFALIKGDDEHSISLIPVKRFMPAVSIYFPESAGEAIVDLLARRLPMQELKLDFIDRITRQLRL